MSTATNADTEIITNPKWMVDKNHWTHRVNKQHLWKQVGTYCITICGSLFTYGELNKPTPANIKCKRCLKIKELKE